MSPRFQGEAFYENLKIVDELDRLAEEKGLETSQLALAWVVGLSPYVSEPSDEGGSDLRDSSPFFLYFFLFSIEERSHADNQVIPIPGSSNAKRVKQNTEAADIKLSEEDLKEINRILAEFEPKGGRYPDHSSGLLVS
jgi:pyridoxine 4-dehydrogenase